MRLHCVAGMNQPDEVPVLSTDFQLRIIQVDHYGFNGRDLHPTNEMVGDIVLPVSMKAEAYDPGGHGHVIEPTLPIDVRQVMAETLLTNPDPSCALLRCWTCLRADGSLVEVMDHEVEFVSIG